MGDVGVAIKELLKGELEELRLQQSKQDERVTQLEKACQDISGSVEERARDAQSIREEMERQQKEHDSLQVRMKELEAFDCFSLKERISRLESDEEGIGGVKQLWQRLENATKDVRDLQPRVDEANRIASATKTRSDDFELQLREFGRQFGEIQSNIRLCEEKWSKVEERSSAVHLAQQALEDSVARKYDRLWEDVLHALEEFKANQLEELRQDLAERRDGARSEAKNVVSYALNVLGTAHAERRKLAFGKDVVTAWREQTWISTRRRMGLWRLRCLMQRRHREALCRWVRQASVEQLSTRLNEELRAQLPDVRHEVEAMGLPRRCQELEGSIADLRADKCSTNQFKSGLAEQEQRLEHRIVAVDYGTTIEKIQSSIVEAHDVGKDALGRAQDNARRLAEQEKVVTEYGQDMLEFAKATEVQTMMRDTLLVWNSIKQLDAAKADKKDFDTFAMEHSSKDRLASRRLEDLETDVANRVREEVSKTQERWSDLDGRVEENAKQFRHWEKMWEKLAGFVEDLVSKIAELQGAAVESGKLPSAGTTLRPHSAGSRASSREAHERLNRAGRATPPPAPPFPSAAVPRLDRSAATESTDALALAGVGGADAAPDSSKMMWMNSARDIVDATLDQAMVPARHMAATRRPVRPSSASAATRRPHDRGRIS